LILHTSFSRRIGDTKTMSSNLSSSMISISHSAPSYWRTRSHRKRDSIVQMVDQPIEDHWKRLSSGNLKETSQGFTTTISTSFSPWHDAEKPKRLASEGGDDDENVDESKVVSKTTLIASISNIFLVGFAVTAMALTGYPIVMISAVVDACMDLVLILVLTITMWSLKKMDETKYPAGRKTIQPTVMLAFASASATIAVAIIVEALKELFEHDDKTANTMVKDINTDAYYFIGASLLTNFFTFVYLWVVYKKTRVLTVKALMIDFRNDSLNFVLASLAVIIIKEVDGAAWLNPAMALAIGIIILVSWLQEGKEAFEQLTGRSADEEVLKDLLAVTHWATGKALLESSSLSEQPHLIKSTNKHCSHVIAYHFGTNFILEVQLLLSKTMAAEEMIRVSDKLTELLEEEHDVERVFVSIQMDQNDELAKVTDESRSQTEKTTPLTPQDIP